MNEEAKIKAFLQEFYGTKSDAFAVNWKPYENGNLVNTVSLDEAIAEIASVYDDCLEFCKGFCKEEKAEEMLISILKKHLVKF